MDPTRPVRAAVRITLLCVALALLASCAGLRYRYPGDPQIAALLAGPPPEVPAVRFAVISDAHLYDTGLGTDGSAFQDYLLNDRKLLVQSEEILVAAIQRIRSQDVSFVLITGDLTKDGERQDHLLMARELTALQKAGIKVYVVPGNHDIDNPHAMSYTAKGATPVASILPAEFAENYRDYGYGEAIARDPGSLSYVVEPVPGLWLLAIDSANYATNRQAGRPVTASGLTQAREDWI
ncbi:MAG TPA: metallophosphoesterase, partial [Spirochaetia bacterium]|nr:metallophosphoesterase [Spirochaetia bacterium]